MSEKFHWWRPESCDPTSGIHTSQWYPSRLRSSEMADPGGLSTVKQATCELSASERPERPRLSLLDDVPFSVLACSSDATRVATSMPFGPTGQAFVFVRFCESK